MNQNETNETHLLPSVKSEIFLEKDPSIPLTVQTNEWLAKCDWYCVNNNQNCGYGESCPVAIDEREQDAIDDRH